MKHVMPIADRPPIIMQRGAGSYLWDNNGRDYLDFVQGWAVNCLGHCPPEIITALTHQSSQLINPSPAFYNPLMVSVSTQLAQLSGLDHVFFTNSGAEANEGAIKLARKWGGIHRDGAYEIITFTHSFHGRTLATMSASGKPGWDTLFEPKVPGFVKVPYADLDAVDAAITPRTVAVMLEVIQGEGGVIPAPHSFVQSLRRLTQQKGLLFIIDEVQTGIARSGALFAHQHYQVQPDILTLGKGLGGGVPVAALLAKDQCSVFEYGDQGGTYNGNPLVLAAVDAVLQAVTAEGFLASVHHHSNQLQTLIASRATEWGVTECRGMGLLLAMQFKQDVAAQLVKKGLSNGLLINAPRPNVIRLMPSLRLTESEIQDFDMRFSITQQGIS